MQKPFQSSTCKKDQVILGKGADNIS